MRVRARTQLTLAVTMGDPRGVGPEVIVKALNSPALPRRARLLVVGSATVLRHTAHALGQALRAPTVWDVESDARGHAVLDLDNFPVERLEPRKPDALSGRAALDYIERAVGLVLAHEADALVTAPISKEAIAAAGSPFPGHTEMLAALSKARRPVMLLVSAKLRVALVTTHLALRDVPGAIRPDDIVEIAQVLTQSLRRLFGIAEPRLAVCGLNPHCGDGGRFGDEEGRLVAPAVDGARGAGITLAGPEPADSVFAQAVRGRYDAVLALYHDQGLIPVKLSGLGRVVNVTLGLPFIRTSVGHGTAYDIAGTGRADERSLLAAIRLAARMVRASRRSGGGAH